jgi:hypothetical protein
MLVSVGSVQVVIWISRHSRFVGTFYQLDSAQRGGKTHWYTLINQSLEFAVDTLGIDTSLSLNQRGS